LKTYSGKFKTLTLTLSQWERESLILSLWDRIKVRALIEEKL
jgi:hypothetical protein